MFESGIVKLSFGDRTWRNLTALDYHYYTQPLPTFIGWYLHHWPRWFRRASVVAVYLNEIALPLLIFGPRECRYLACAGIVFLMLLILLTGNYCFFNLLTMALATLLVRRQRLAAHPAAVAHLGSVRRPRCPRVSMVLAAPAYWPRSCC